MSENERLLPNIVILWFFFLFCTFLLKINALIITCTKISDIPRIYVFDTPGILHPNIKDMEVAMNLALCGKFYIHSYGSSDEPGIVW